MPSELRKDDYKPDEPPTKVDPEGRSLATALEETYRIFGASPKYREELEHFADKLL